MITAQSARSNPSGEPRASRSDFTETNCQPISSGAKTGAIVWKARNAVRHATSALLLLTFLVNRAAHAQSVATPSSPDTFTSAPAAPPESDPDFTFAGPDGTMYQIVPPPRDNPVAETSIFIFVKGAKYGVRVCSFPSDLAPQGASWDKSAGVFYVTTKKGGPAGTGTIQVFNPAQPVVTELLAFAGALGAIAGNPQGAPVVVEDAGETRVIAPIANGGETTSTNENGLGGIVEWDAGHLASFKYQFLGTNGESPQGLTASNSANQVARAIHPSRGGPARSAPRDLSTLALYGTTALGGAGGAGTVFSVNADGSGFMTLHNFTNAPDGANPRGGLVLAGNTLYGTTFSGGARHFGTIFSVQTDGTGYTNLFSFSGTNGSGPIGVLVVNGSTLSGVTANGGPHSDGVVFTINTDGTGFLLRHAFSATPSDGNGNFTNFDGAYPVADLGFSGDTLVGTTSGGGTNGAGTLFWLPPVAPFTVAPTNGAWPATVQFTSTNMDSLGNAITNWNWDFGDGFTSAEQNPSHTYLNASLFFPRFIATNSNTNAVYGVGPPVNVAFANLVANGGFETGGLASWTKTGDAAIQSGAFFAHSGNACAIGSAATLSQTLATAPGTSYLLSFWIKTYAGTPIDEFLALWNGAVVADIKAGNGSVWTNIQTVVTAAGASASLVFKFTDKYGDEIFLDDVSVTASGPGVAVTASPTNGPAPLTVDFSSPAEDSAGNAITNWYWIFGDGSTSSAQNPSHIYTSQGNFSAILYAIDSAGVGANGSAPAIVAITPAVGFAAAPAGGPAPLTVQFAGPATDNLGNAVTNWVWTYGDGTSGGGQNPSHVYANPGVYAPALAATDNAGITAPGSGSPIVASVAGASDLVVNGGFETGNFAGWTAASRDFVTMNSFVHSGVYGAGLGQAGSLGYLSQTLDTTPGAEYLLSFWLDSADGQTPSEFQVSWDGVVLVDQKNLPAFGWTNLLYVATATATNTALQFGVRDDSSYLGLDDVSVAAVQFPAPTISGVALAGPNLVINGANGAPGSTVYALMTTNLALPLSQWTPVSTNVLGVNASFAVTLTNAVTLGAAARYYILQLQ
jgi:uncharacterized repeat protein (TIGR03803 family)